MYPTRSHAWLLPAALVFAAPAALAQQRPLTPHLGYAFPAGGKQGTTVQIVVGGQALVSPSAVYISGSGVRASVVKYSRPMNNREALLLRDKLEAALKKLQEDPNGPPITGGLQSAGVFLRVAKEAGITEEEMQKLAEFRRRQGDKKRQLNPQLDETVLLSVDIDANAAPGRRELRLRGLAGLSNPVAFEVGAMPECIEVEPNDRLPDTCIPDPLPAVVNGQILPGDVDRFAFKAKKGARIVAAVEARQLIPYLADAVPGWIQPVVTIRDAKGRELAYDDHFYFRIDPVVCCQIPEDGEYVLEVRDSIYRGREDFVYRVTLGEVPFVTGVFPLGGRADTKTEVALTGWNLEKRQAAVDTAAMAPGVHEVAVVPQAGGAPPFDVDTLPEVMEKEPNDRGTQAQSVRAPAIVNGRIGKPGDVDVYRIEGKAGDRVVAEVLARRLGSPVDSALELLDADGRQIAANDDYDDKGFGLLTHQADSVILARLPRTGAYYIRLRDAQRQGGPEYAYRLRISAPRPDYDLRVVPSSLTARAGTIVAVTVCALRKDGFTDSIDLRLVGAPFGYALTGARIPAGQDSVRVTLAVPPRPQPEPVELRLEGVARIAGADVRHVAQPAEDMMQAFAYRHLVPAEKWLVGVLGRGQNSPAIRAADTAPLQIRAGGTAKLRLTAPAWLVRDDLRFSLDTPPDGITIESVSAAAGDLAIVLRVDGQKVKPGLKGNLIVDAFRETTTTPANAKQPVTRRSPIGTLPAVPFEVVAG